MKIRIDGKEVEAREGQSILDAALDAGVFIPHLCSHPDLEAKGGCRLCSVEIEGEEGAVPACKTEVREGMEVTVNGPVSSKVRKMAMELILATHPADCTGCPKYGKCELQSMYQYMGVSPEGWRKKSRSVANDDSNPLITHLFTRCVRCGRCIRACQELRGVKVLDYIRTPAGIRAGVPKGESLKDAGCRFCGACIEVCPTGSIMDQVKIMKEERSYAENIVPCRSTCPAHTDIPRYIRYVKNGEFEKAAAVVREKVPFPRTLGYICTHVCELECKRKELGEAVSVRDIKRYAADHDTGSCWKGKGKQLPDTGKKVCVAGGGPAGLTAAYYLRKQGHAVTLKEALPMVGGMMYYGIPSYRLPREIIAEEAAVIEEAGVKIEVNTKVEKPAELLKEYDAVLMAVGCHKGLRLPIEGSNLEGVILNADFLRNVSMGRETGMGEKVIVLGAGDVAFDCARSAVRLGAKEVHLACRKKLEDLTAHPEEIKQAEEEGVLIHPGRTFDKICGETHVEGVQFSKIKSIFYEEAHKATVEKEENSEHTIPCDTVIFATGLRPDITEEAGLKLGKANSIAVKDMDTNQAASIEGIFAAGDAVYGTKSVIEAIAAGRKAAEQMDLYLGGDGDISEKLLEDEAPSPYIGQVEGFAGLNRAEPKVKAAEERTKDFALVEQTFTCEQAQYESGRCLQCDLRLGLSKPKLWNEY